MKTRIVVTAPFEAARQVAILPEGHRARKIHGHSFLASLHVAMPPGMAEYPGGEVDTIKARLEHQIQHLDYRLLNEVMETPTDENIARWINTHCYVPWTEQIAIQSTADEGVHIDMQGKAVVWRRYHFQAAHQLPNVAPGHKCGNLHGHSFSVVLHANHHIGEGDLSIDYNLLDRTWAPVFQLLDHAYLNEIEGLNNPTSEHLSRWIWEQLKPHFAELSCVSVYETGSCGANYNGTDFEIWKDFSFDSSVKFKHAPVTSKRSRVHGYTYTLRLLLTAPLDAHQGWAIDFGEVKNLFNPLFKTLDHVPLWQNPALADCDVVTLGHYIYGQTKTLLPQLSGLELYEVRGCGVTIREEGYAHSLPL
jgi:6-pyruvoyltetrahydropterin/6-carboxytetrahydropterin synthase